MATLALAGSKTIYQTSISKTNLPAITTNDVTGNTFLMVTNTYNSTYKVTDDLYALITVGTRTMWR